MACPSVVKVTKNGIEYTSKVDQANYYIFELTRAALKDIRKFVKKEYKNRYYQELEKHTGEGPKAIKGDVFSSKNTKYPRVDIGIPHSSPGNPVKGFYSFFHEVGTAYEPKHGILYNTVNENIATITEIESQYLSALSADKVDDSMIDEEDSEGADE